MARNSVGALLLNLPASGRTRERFQDTPTIITKQKLEKDKWFCTQSAKQS